ncbi:TonB-dependent receptor [Stakelama tenebrarum]|uniref:TonB-dependent receptor n=1 Tax=Stakelama tenebrarum TaxID=2711215 RepID=A0A6G6Y3V4_9SPHN|nr:TonB-dependent receptor [Sphingosinithalassobacter tenebrarum]QIG79595.1 TonB-dependent receptor [Sphingosinithalassobacter tenebrarum]
MLSRFTLAALAASTSIMPVAQAQAEARFSFDLPAQSLETSLRAVAARTGTNIVFSSAEVANKTAAPLRGSHSARSAYQALLAGSGLSLTVTSGGSFVVRTAPARQSGQQQQGRGTLAGHVTGPDGAAGVTGALVRIVETGATTAVDEYGNFRFPGIRAGTYTVEISFLGYETVTRTVTVTPGDSTRVDLALGGSTDVAGAEIVVYGSLSARANALNQQRTADNSADVVSADDLGNFTGTTFSEALRRVPGISFQRDSATGDGSNVIVRGFEPDMNQVKLNGLNLPVGNGSSRSADLSNLLADSVSSITVNKTLLPSHDSAGTGGLIEIETMSPLDRPRRYANLLVEGGQASDDFDSDYLVSGTIAGTFGNDFGLSASVQYRNHEQRTIGYGTTIRTGRALPLDENGLPTYESTDEIDPYATFPFVEGADQAYVTGLTTRFDHIETEYFTGTLSAEWQVASHTNLKFDFQHSETNQTYYSLADTFSVSAEYSDLPGGYDGPELSVDLTPGNEAISRSQSYGFSRDVKNVSDTYALNGKTNLGAFEIKYLAGYAHGSLTNPRGFSQSLRLGAVSGGTALDAQANYFLPEAFDGGTLVSAWAPRTGDGIPLPLLSAQGWGLINDPAGFTVQNASGQIDESSGNNDRYTASGSVRWQADKGFLSYVELGAFYERAEFHTAHSRSQIGGNVLATDVGLNFVPSDLSRIGVDVPGFTVVSEGSLRDFVNNIDQVAGSTGLTITDLPPVPGEDDEMTRETNLAAYLQTKLQFGKLEIVGGVRYNRVKLEARNLVYPVYTGPILPENGGGVGVDLVFQNEFSRLVTESGTTEEFLPRILFNYRESDDLIFRGGYFMSVARPQISLLSNETRISFINFPIPGPQGTKPILQINSGNPDLKPATTHNFDLSAEYYSGVGIFKLSGFHKRTENLLQSNISNGAANLDAVTLPDHPYFQGPPYFDPANPDSVFITGSTPVNSDDVAELWGVEVQAERRFDFLPGVWGGFGVYANYTYTHSSRVDRYSWAYTDPDDNVFEFSGVPYSQSPKHSGTFALTYNKYDIDATLSYAYQSRALSSFYPRGLSYYAEDAQSLDLRVEYYLRPDFGQFRIFLEGSDLLKGTDSPDVAFSLGDDPKFHSSATYLGGRSFKLGVSASF